MLTKKDYERAILIQDAVNLTAVVNDFVEVLHKIWDEVGNTGTDYVNQHPISKLYADKIADLARVRDVKSYMDAYNEVEKEIAK